MLSQLENIQFILARSLSVWSKSWLSTAPRQLLGLVKRRGFLDNIDREMCFPETSFLPPTLGKSGRIVLLLFGASLSLPLAVE